MDRPDQLVPAPPARPSIPDPVCLTSPGPTGPAFPAWLRPLPGPGVAPSEHLPSSGGRTWSSMSCISAVTRASSPHYHYLNPIAVLTPPFQLHGKAPLSLSSLPYSRHGPFTRQRLPYRRRLWSSRRFPGKLALAAVRTTDLHQRCRWPRSYPEEE